MKKWSFNLLKFSFLFLFTTVLYATPQQYEIYFDADLNTGTGCTALHTGLPNIQGIESKVTVTIDNQPPAIISTNLHQCLGAVFDAGIAIDPAAIGLNTGSGNTDVIEVKVSNTDLPATPGQDIQLYFATGSTTAEDVVLETSALDPIILSIASSTPIPVPALGLLAVFILTFLLSSAGKSKLSSTFSLALALIVISPILWAMSIIIDGQTTDWAGIAEITSDPSSDTSQIGSFADINNVYAFNSAGNTFIRMDLVELEEGVPVADDGSQTLLEDSGSTLLTVTGTDPNLDPLTFTVSQAPTKGTIGAITVVNDTTTTIAYTPNANAVGTDTFEFIANDGMANSIAATFTVTLTPVNDVPSFTKGANQTSVEDGGAQTVNDWATAISKGPADESTQTVSFTVTNNNNSLFSSQPAVSSAGVLTYTAAANATGSATVTLHISDDGGTTNGGIDTSVNQSFTITITDVNDAPSFTKGADQTVLEDAAAQTVNGWATALSKGPSNESSQTLSFNVSNNNSALFSSQPAVSSTGNLTFTPAVNANGSAIVTVNIMDNGGTANGGVDTSANQTFTITITAVNDAPSFTKGTDQSVLVGSVATTVNGWASAISTGPANESGQSITGFNVTNDNNALFTTQPAVDNTGTLTFDIGAATGTATVTISVSDDGGTANGGSDTSASQIFTITSAPLNQAPSFAKGSDQSVLEDSGAQTINAWATSISPGPPSEAGQTLTFNVSNNNSTLFSSQPAISSTGTLTYTPAANANGAATVTVNLMDDGGTAGGGVDTSPNQTFTITVTAVNDTPSFISGGNVSVLEDSGAYSQAWASGLSKGPIDESIQSLSFNIIGNDMPGLFSSAPTINNSGQLSFTPAADAVGIATISVNIMDNGGTANGGSDTSATQIFTVSLNQVNDEPQFTKGTDQIVVQNSGAQTVIGWVTASSVGPANEAGQTLSYNTSNNNNALFSTQPSVNSSGDLTFTSALNQNGVATVTINAMDDGGTANGGDNTSPDQTFTITITNLPPARADSSYNVTTNIQINIPAATGLLNGATGGTGALTVGNAMNPAPTTTTNGGDLSITAATGVFTYNPPAGQDSGTDTFTYKVCDSVGACSANIIITLNISGQTIWFMDKAAVAGGDGRLTKPFNSIAGFNAIQGGVGVNHAATGDIIYMKAGSYNGSFALLANQTLLGEGTPGVFDTVTGISPSADSATRPLLAGAKPTVSSPGDAISIAGNNTVRGLEITNTTNYAIQGTGAFTADNVNISGTGGLLNINGLGAALNVQFGNLSSSSSISNPVLQVQGYASGSFVSDTTGTNITSTTSAVVFANNTITAAFNNAGLTINSGNSNAFVANNGGTFTAATGVIITGTGTAINLFNGSKIGAANLTFQSISHNGGATAVILDNTGAGSFNITGNGGVCSLAASCSGGTIQNTSSHGMILNNVNGISFTRVKLQNTGNANDEDALEIANPTGTYTIDNSTFTNAADDAIEVNYTAATSVAAFSVLNSVFEGIGDFPNGIFNSSAGNNFAGAAMDFNIDNGATITNLTIDNLEIENFDGRGISIDVGGPVTAGSVTGVIQNTTITGIGTIGVSVVTDGSGVADVILKDSDVLKIDNSPALVSEANGAGSTTFAAARQTMSVVNETYFFVACTVLLNDGNVITDIPTYSGTLDSNTCSDAADGYTLNVTSRGSQGTMNSRITNNTYTASSGSFSYGLFTGAGNGTAGEGDTICSNISANDIDGDSGQSGIASFMYSGTTHRIQGLTGSGSNQVNVENFIGGNNLLSLPVPTADADFTGVISYTAANCSTPPVP